MHDFINFTFLVLIILRRETAALGNLKSNDNVNISEFTEGIRDCEIQIVHDNIDRIDLGPSKSPITIIYSPRRRTRRRRIFMLERDISRTRDWKCKISLIVCNISKQTEIKLTNTASKWDF